MAATALMNPVPAYHPHKPPFPPPYHQPPSNMPGMVSPGDSRRTPNEPEPVQRQSLPSISEVFSGAKPTHYSPTTPTTLAGPHSLPPPPFGSSLPPRSEPPPEPRPAPPSHEDKFFRYPQRPDVGPPLGPPGPPSSAYGYPEQRDPTKPPEAVPNAGHTNPPPPPQIPYPAGQYPLPPAPISPHHLGPPLPPYDQSRPPLHADEDYGMHRTRYDSTLNRHFESWGYQDCLNKVCPPYEINIWTLADGYSSWCGRQGRSATLPKHTARLLQSSTVDSLSLNDYPAIKKSRACWVTWIS